MTITKTDRNVPAASATAATQPFALQRNRHGKLVLTGADGAAHAGVAPVRAFPVQAPDEGISMVSEDGHEVAWIESLAALPPAILTLIEEELEGREFMPVIETIVDVSSFSTPSTWHVQTDRGPTSFILRGEEDIRRIGAGALLVADNHGINFLIRDPATMDRNSRRILDRFL
jgi:hypothetical protein